MIPLELGMVFQFNKAYGLEIIIKHGGDRTRWMTYRIKKDKVDCLTDRGYKYMYENHDLTRIQPFKLELLHILYKGE